MGTVVVSRARWLPRRLSRLWRGPQAVSPLDRLCATLKAQLGPFGYQWFCACAVYPGLRWPLTVYLGSVLAEAMGRPAPDEMEHLTLARLPWFRKGQMPDGLRLRLLAELTPANRKLVREALERLFFNLLDHKLEPADRYYEIDVAKIPPAGWRGRLRGWFDSADVARGTPEQDLIFARYMMGRTPRRLDLALDRTLSRLFGVRLTGWFDTRALLAGATAFAGALVIGIASGLHYTVPTNEVAVLDTAERFGAGEEDAGVSFEVGEYGRAPQLQEQLGPDQAMQGSRFSPEQKTVEPAGLDARPDEDPPGAARDEQSRPTAAVERRRLPLQILRNLGPPVTAPLGLEFQNVISIRLEEGGIAVVMVKGEIVNVTAGDRTVPRVLVALLDDGRRELQRELVAAAHRTLSAGGITHFAGRLVNPPMEASSFSVTFAAGS